MLKYLEGYTVRGQYFHLVAGSNQCYHLKLLRIFCCAKFL